MPTWCRACRVKARPRHATAASPILAHRPAAHKISAGAVGAGERVQWARMAGPRAGLRLLPVAHRVCVRLLPASARLLQQHLHELMLRHHRPRGRRRARLHPTLAKCVKRYKTVVVAAAASVSCCDIKCEHALTKQPACGSAARCRAAVTCPIRAYE